MEEQTLIRAGIAVALLAATVVLAYIGTLPEWAVVAVLLGIAGAYGFQPAKKRVQKMRGGD